MSAAEDSQSGRNQDFDGEDLSKLRSRLEALFQEGQWQASVILSSRMLENWPGLSDVTLMNFKARQGLELDQELRRRLAQAQQSGLVSDWQASWQTAQTLVQLSPANPGYRKFLEQAEQNIVWSSLIAQVEDLLKTGRWSEAAGILAGVPADLPSAATWRAEIERRQKEAESQLSGHLERAEIAYRAGDLDGAIALLDQALRRRPDEPQLKERRQRWLEERDWRSRVEEARRRYDLDRLHGLLEVGSAYSQAEPLRAWLEQEGERRRQILIAISTYDVDTVQELISGMPEHHPDMPQLQRWLEIELRRNEQIHQARERSDARRVMELLSQVTVNYPGYRELTEWVARESEQTFGAVQSGLNDTLVQKESPPAPTSEPPTQWEPEARAAQPTLVEPPPEADEKKIVLTPLDPLADTQTNAPAKVDTEERLRQAKEAFAAQDWQHTLQILEDIPDDDPQAGQLRSEARQQWIAQLYAQARAAEANQDWEAAKLAWLNLQVLQVENPQIVAHLEAIPREINYAQLLSRAEGALTGRKWQPAIQAAEQASRLFPDRQEPRRLLARAQGILTRQRRRRLAVLLTGGIGLFSILGIALAWTAVSAGWLPGLFARTATSTSAPPSATQTPVPPSPSPTASVTRAPALVMTSTASPSPTEPHTLTPTATLTVSPTTTLRPPPPTAAPTATKRKEPKPPDDEPPPDEPTPTQPPEPTEPPPPEPTDGQPTSAPPNPGI